MPVTTIYKESSFINWKSGGDVLVQPLTGGGNIYVQNIYNNSPGGGVQVDGTPEDNQVAVFTGFGTIEGDSGLTYNSITGGLKLSLIDAGDGDEQSLIITAGDASGAAGINAGDLILKAGDAILGDVNSLGGDVNLVPGSGYQSGGTVGWVHLGGSLSLFEQICIDTLGDATDIHLLIHQKGGGYLQLGNADGMILLNGGINGTIELQAPMVHIGYPGNANATIKAHYGLGTVGVHLTLQAGDAETGDNDGGNIYLVGGTPSSSLASYGEIYFENAVHISDPIYFGDNDTYIYESSDDVLELYLGGYQSIVIVTSLGKTTMLMDDTGQFVSWSSKWVIEPQAVAATNGLDLELRSGEGSTNHGDIYLVTKIGSETAGDYYLGTGSEGNLPAKGSETDVVYYDPATGKLSYG